jgi:hypothetical protein
MRLNFITSVGLIAESALIWPDAAYVETAIAAVKSARVIRGRKIFTLPGFDHTSWQRQAEQAG